jgi:hypothetical protein
MAMNRRRLLIGALAVAVVVLVGDILWMNLDLAFEHHLDGEGPLGSFGSNGTEVTLSFSATVGGPIWSVGLELCLARGNRPAVLDGSVGPTQTAGRGFKYLGALVREFTPVPGASGMGSRDGFPPPNVPETLQPVPGFAVTHRCQHPIVDDNIPITELVLGFGRASDASGGGWLGVDVSYNSNGRHHVVSLRFNFVICGPAAPKDICEGQSSPTPSD